MPKSRHLGNILVRMEKAAELLRLEPWLLEKLSGFKLCWRSDIEAKMDDGSLRHFQAVRVWHRSPHTDQPHKGGIRYHPLVGEDMMKAHAIEMSLKCWLMDIEWGGAKGGVAVDPLKHSANELKNITESFVDEMDERNILGPFRDVPAPDAGTNAQIMNWVRQRYAQRRRSREDARFAGVVTGKPVGYGFGGIPGRNEATGYGLAAVLRYHLQRHGAVSGAPRIAIMGFGNVGSHLATFVRHPEGSQGVTVVAVSDVNGGVYAANGLDIPALRQYYAEAKTLAGFPGSEPITNDELLTLDVEILAPSALEHVITERNADAIRARVVLEGANGPTTPEADEVLQSKGIVVIPDIVANAGGVTVSFFEWARNVNIRDERVPRPEKEQVLSAMSMMLVESYSRVYENALRYRTSLRHAAYLTAIERVAPLFRSKHIA